MIRTTFASVMIVAVFIVAGCAEGPAQERHDQAVEVEVEAIDWLDEIKTARARVIAAIDKLEGLRGEIPDDTLAAALHAAAVELAEMNTEVEEARSQREQAADVVALRADELDAAKARDASLFGIADTGAEVLGLFGLGGIGAVVALVKRGRSQRLKGEKITADGIRNHITLLRQDPALDAAFNGLDEKTKRAADTALTALPHVLALIKKK